MGGQRRYPGFSRSESRREFQERCIAGLDQVVREACENQWREAALIVHGGTIMSILEAYGFPHQDYYSWHVENAEGYRVRLDPQAFLRGSRQLIVDGKIVRGWLSWLRHLCRGKATPIFLWTAGTITGPWSCIKTGRMKPLSGPIWKNTGKEGFALSGDGGDHFGASFLARKLAPEYGDHPT